MSVSELNKYVAYQQSLGQEIQKLYNNIKKDSATRKTEDYIQRRRDTVQDLWKKIEETHTKIEGFDIPTHEYFTTNYFIQLQKLYHDVINHLVQDAKAATVTGPSLKEDDEDPEQVLRIKRQEVRIQKIQQLYIKIQHDLTLQKPKSAYDYLQKQIQEYMDNIRKLEEDIQVFETRFTASYFTEEKFLNCESTFHSIMEQLHKTTPQPSHTFPHQEQNLTIPLPTIKLPIFDGTYENWTTFHDLFLKIIHSNQSLTNVEKMQYLKTHLKGEPSRIIQHLNISESNYDSAWTLLQRRYQNSRLSLSKLLDRILDLPKSTTESAEKIKELHDTTLECLQAINNLGVSTTSWGPIISRLIARKWDNETNKLYEQSLKNPNSVQEFQELTEFLQTRFQSLEAIGDKTKRYQPATQHPKSEQNKTCKYCGGDHYIHTCNKFQDLPVKKREEFANSNNLCRNCLYHKYTGTCNSTKRCLKCRKAHHTLLHKDEKKPTTSKTTVHVSQTSREQLTESDLREDHPSEQHDTVLLATALVKAKSSSGSTEYLRVLIDQGSQASFITESAAHILAHPREKIRAEISGLGDGNPKTSKWRIQLPIQPHFPSNFSLQTTFLVLPKLTQSLPNHKIPELDSQDTNNKILADPTYNTPGPIDAIIGAEEYGKILEEGLQKTNDGILGQKTKLGWILSGHIKKRNTLATHVTSLVSRIEEDQQLTKFWELEETEKAVTNSEDDGICEKFYRETTKRNSDGTYTVKIPFKSQVELGCSKSRAGARLFQLENRLAKNQELKTQYDEFMDEYIRLGHMKKITAKDGPAKYYIPHQAVLRPSSTTTKLRVVFDASCKSSNGKSLNDFMHTGPRLQQDLADILLRWRKHKVVFSADIEKMYRQIRVDEKDQQYQRILWRFDRHSSIQEYKLTTVTYGTTSAPYLAVNTLQQLAREEHHNYPQASEVAQRDFYVDDLLSGGDSVQEACEIQEQLTKMLKTGGLTLRKWVSNKEELLLTVPDNMKEKNEKEITEDWLSKSLGVFWAPRSDTFRFKVNTTAHHTTTKRTILSEIAKLFDPLGWLSPVIIRAKLLIQDLWLQELEWDCPVPTDIKNRWQIFQDQLNQLEEIQLPRWINTTKNNKVELHGFCDASEKAYGAVVYVRCIQENSQIQTTLLTAKSKVAPVRSKTTLPRLELCAAVLLAKLIKRSINTLQLKQDTPVWCWSDSTITLAWIKGDPSRWKTFVGNRVSEINRITPKDCWRHVDTNNNPADIISRGIDPSKLINHAMWWHGPGWLQREEKWPRVSEVPATEEEKKSKTITSCHQSVTEIKSLINHFSSFTKMVRVLSYCRRFAERCRKSTRQQGSLTTKEMGTTFISIVQEIQKHEFHAELKSIQRNGQVDMKSKIAKLHPFLDDNGVLRVGGRLQNSLLAYEEKHPIILPYDSHFSTLLIHQAHHTTFHGGNQLTLAHLRRRFWIINAKRAVQKIIRKCVKCLRYKAQTAKQLMGELPAPRVTPSPPFTHTGVDYAGPIQMRTTKGRGHKSYKGYIAVFVCLTTRAIHIEAVSDMTTEGFLAAYRRFVSRRGHCTHIYSDNGTNFVGAQKRLCGEVTAITENPEVQDALVIQGTTWHFIPPAAPHFGGIWEAGVKSIKHHLKRVVGDSTLTFEELTTLLYQVEACLNSRPLFPISEDVTEEVITPGHFLIGRPIISPPDKTATIHEALSTRWKLIQKMKNDFWKSWSREYLSRLQQRFKWTSREENLKPGDVVIVKDNVIDPSRWPLAKITETHPAADGIVRVVTLKKAGGSMLKRSIHNLIPLPTVAPQKENPHQENKICNLHTVHCPIRNSRSKARSAFGTIITLLLLSITAKSTLAATYSVQDLKPGLYVEHMGHAKIERGFFRLDTKINISRITNDMNTAANAVREFRHMCDNITTMGENLCQNLLHHLQEEEKHLQWTHQGLKSVLQRRQKRGLLGKLLTSIFGVNDEVYRDIDTIEANQKELIKASNHQTKFMLSAFSTINTTEAKMYAHLERFRKKLDEGLKTMNRMQSWFHKIDMNELNLHVLSSYHIVINIINEISDFYNKVTHIHLNLGNLYDIVAPAHIYDLISSTNAKLPSNIQILQSPVIKTKVESDRDNIIIHTYFPMAEIIDFTIIKVNTVPLKIGNTSYWTLDIMNNMIAIDYNTQVYFEMSDRDFNDCIRVQEAEYLCAPSSVKNIENAPNCLIDEIYQRTEKSTCSIREYAIKSVIWKQLYMKNTWMYISTKPFKIAITCNGIREDVSLNTTGVIQVNQECVIATRQNIITPKRDDSVTVLASFSHPMVSSIVFSTANPSVSEEETKEETVIKASDELSKLITNEAEIQDRTWRLVKHHSIFLSISTTAAVLVAVVILGSIGRWYMMRRRRTTPATTKGPEEEIPLRTLSPPQHESTLEPIYADIHHRMHQP